MRQLILMETTTSSITLYRSKSQLAKTLGISRKTIQRKVAKGELSQDSKGRVRVDELIARLKLDSIQNKRGPKMRLGISNYNSVTYKYNGRHLERVLLSMDELTKKNETVNNQFVNNIIQQISDLSSATLEEIANQAMSVCQHKRRLAKIGLSIDGDKIIKILNLKL
jgi:hypothetical protein